MSACTNIIGALSAAGPMAIDMYLPALPMIARDLHATQGQAEWSMTTFFLGLMFGQPFDSKTIYTFHKYWTPTTQAVIQEYLDYRDKYNVPIYCGETGENKDAWVHDFRVLLEANNIGWHYWPYKKMDNAEGIITFKVPEGFDKVIEYADKTRTGFKDIRDAAPASRAQIQQALNGVLENCKFENCTPNKGYIEALGLSVGK